MEVRDRAPVVEVLETQCEAVLAGCLAVRAQPCRECGGLPRVGDCRHPVSAPGGVMCEPVVVRAAEVGQGREGPVVELRPCCGATAGLDGLPGDVVAERKSLGGRVRHQQPALDALVDRVGGSVGDRCDQWKPRARAEHRRGGQHVVRCRRHPAHPCAYGVPHRVRHLLGAGREHLADEERVAVRTTVQRLGVEGRAGCLCEREDGRWAQRRQVHAYDAVGAGQVSHHGGQPVTRADLLVAVGRHHQQGQPVESSPRNRTSSRVASSAQWRSSSTRIVGCAASRARISRNSRGRVAGVVSSIADSSSGSASMTGPRGGGVATLSQEPRRTRGGVGERCRAFQQQAHQRGLPDPRLATQEHPTTAGGRRRRHGLEQRREE